MYLDHEKIDSKSLVTRTFNSGIFLYLEEGVRSGGPLFEVLSQDVGQVSQVLQQDNDASEAKKTKVSFLYDC
jgi:hypothetical protein